VLYRSVRPPQEALRKRIRDLANVRVRAGYEQIYVLLRREGWPVNHKRVYRLYCEEGLSLRVKRPRRHRTAIPRIRVVQPSAPNQQWAMDFMHDTLANGETIRVLTAIDVFTRECVALRAAKHFRAPELVMILRETTELRGTTPLYIKVDNGSEFTSKALDHWAYWSKVQLDFSRPGKPGDNARIEAFNGNVRRECLSQHWFVSVEDAQRELDAWREDYNFQRPHKALAGTPPSLFRVFGWPNPEPNLAPKLASRVVQD
jgi:putative transposase